MEIEPLLNTPGIRKLQWKKLKRALKWQYENSPFNQKRFDKAGVKPEDIKNFDDFATAIPICGQAEIREAIEEVGLDMYKLMHHLFGERRMTIFFYLLPHLEQQVYQPHIPTSKLLEGCTRICSRAAWRVGIRPGDRVGLCFGLSMHAAGTPVIIWFMNYPGVMVVPIGAEAGSDRILQFLKLFKVNIFLGTPSLALHLIERAPEVLGEPIKNLGIKILICGAEPGLDLRLENALNRYGGKLFDLGAGYGVSCDYPIYQGMHWIADDVGYYELVDPVTKKPIPLTNGATGLMCATSLHPEGAVWFDLRFTMNDIHQIFTDPCPCGFSGFRYKIVGRVDDMLKVKGVPVYPASIEGVIHSFVPQITGAFRIVLDEPPPRVVPPLKLKIEYGEGIKKEQLAELEKAIKAKMHADLKISPAIEWLKPNTLERSAKKTQLLEKLYEKK